VIALDSSVLVDILTDQPDSAASDQALRNALGAGPVVACDVVISEVCSSLVNSDELFDALSDLGVTYSHVEMKSAIRAGEMQRRYRQRGGRRDRTVPDFIVGAHALLQCDGLITRDAGFFRDYFKGLKVIVPKAPQ
jgi:predicted nucleic acid-binding protein